MTPTDQKPSILSLIQPLISQVQIQSVNLCESSTHRNLEIDEPDQMRLEYNFKVTTGRSDDLTSLRVLVAFKISGHELNSNTSDDVFFRVEGTFALAYKIKSAEGIGEQNVEAFGKMNGVFNAWPYWREFVQSSVSRLGLPPITVPVLTVDGLQKIYQAQDTAAESSQDDTPDEHGSVK